MISVVVVNWNRRELLRACLASLERQTGVEFETIVVDNGSTDGSAEMVEREFGWRVIRNTENRGFCAANNQGIAAARGEFMALLNNDAEAEPGWLAALERACSGRADVGMAASKVLVWEEPGRMPVTKAQSPSAAHRAKAVASPCCCRRPRVPSGSRRCSRLTTPRDLARAGIRLFPTPIR